MKYATKSVLAASAGVLALGVALAAVPKPASVPHVPPSRCGARPPLPALRQLPA